MKVIIPCAYPYNIGNAGCITGCSSHPEYIVVSPLDIYIVIIPQDFYHLISALASVIDIPEYMKFKNGCNTDKVRKCDNEVIPLVRFDYGAYYAFPVIAEPKVIASVGTE